jgi:hypothetical protein
MNLKPRTTCFLRSLLALALALWLLPLLPLAQQRGRRPPRSSSTTQSKTAERAKREQALLLLVETADKARTFDDLLYRAHVQKLVAEVLWPHDARQARAIFRRAWEAAAASDKAEQEEAAREAGAAPAALPQVTEARDEVLRAAAARDARLAELFLRDLAEGKDDGKSARHEPTRRSTWLESSANSARRLALAGEMLEAGATRRAVEIAAPLISEGVRANLVSFILRLRRQSVPAADALYMRLLERAAADPRTEANSLLLLSSYVISPGLMVMVDEFGSLQFTLSDFGMPPVTQQTISPQIQTAFYNLAGAVLSRPVAGPEPLTMQNLTARFYAIGRFLPFFENSSAYAAYAPTLRLRQSELFNEIEASRREHLSAQFSANRPAPKGYIDPLRYLADELAHAPDSAARERIALSMLRVAVRNRYWDRARRAAAEIEDVERRRVALSFLQIHQIKDISQAYKEEKDDDFEPIAKFVREADVPPFAQAWGLAQTAIIAARKRDSRTAQNVAELLDEAESHAARSAQGKPERVAAYGVIATIASRLDPPRAWRLLLELVKAANAVEDFTGDEMSFALIEDVNSAGAVEAENFSVEAEVFRLDQIFATMAHLDSDKALTEARALDGDVPQALATIAVARTILENRR